MRFCENTGCTEKATYRLKSGKDERFQSAWCDKHLPDPKRELELVKLESVK